MSKKICCFVIFILIVPSFFVITGETVDNCNILNNGWLEQRDGVKILHISGNHYEMGFQHGYLLRTEIEQNYRTILSLDDGTIYDEILDLWNNSIEKFIPSDYLDEMKGLADGSGQNLNDVIVFTIGFATFLFDFDCMELCAWGPATEDGELIHLRSYDVPLFAKDPLSGIYLQENQVLIVRKPENGYSSLYSTFAGDIFSRGGMNSQSIAISCESSPSSNVNYNATWFTCRILKVLDSASTLNETIDIMRSSKQGSSNYIISDGNSSTACVYEESADFSYIGSWNDDVESIPPFWEIDHVIRRKNFYIHPTNAKEQRTFYDPRYYFVLGLFPKNDNWFTPWRYYRTVSIEIEKQWGSLNINNTMELLRSIYMGETDGFLCLYSKLGLEPFYACRQWVSYPKSGDILVTYADGSNQAQYNCIHRFNLYDLLDSEPPAERLLG